MTTQELTRWAAQWRGWEHVADIPEYWRRDGDILYEGALPQVATDSGEALKLLVDMGVPCDIHYLGKEFVNPWEVAITIPHDSAIFTVGNTLPDALCEALYIYCANQAR